MGIANVNKAVVSYFGVSMKHMKRFVIIILQVVTVNKHFSNTQS